MICQFLMNMFAKTFVILYCTPPPVCTLTINLPIYYYFSDVLEDLIIPFLRPLALVCLLVILYFCTMSLACEKDQTRMDSFTMLNNKSLATCRSIFISAVEHMYCILVITVLQHNVFSRIQLNVNFTLIRFFLWLS